MNSNSKSSIRLFLAFAAFLLAATTGHAATPEAGINAVLRPASLPAVRDVRWRRVGSELTALHEQYMAHKATGSLTAFAPDAKYLRVTNDSVVIDTAADGDVADLIAALERLGATHVTAFKRVVSARLPLAAIPKLADITSLRLSRPARALTHVGSVTSQGDAAMKTDDARTAFGVDGSGVTVGALSDTFDCGAATPGDYATDIGTGDLPAGIEVLDDSSCDGIDEGRAMLQLIFDVAPGADLSFHTAFGGQADFALGIQELAGCPPGSEPGCTPAAVPADVVVDDVFYYAEPFFQDGIIAQAAESVAAAGVPYFSAAGNSARTSWEGVPFDSSGISPPGLAGADAHDFDPGASEDIYQEILFPPGVTFFSFQWDQPFGSVSGPPGSMNDLDLCIYTDPPPPSGSLITCGFDANISGDPVEVFGISNPSGGFVAANAVIINAAPGAGPAPGLMKYVAFNSGFSVVDPYPMVMASTVVGLRNASHVVGVGAAFYGDTPEFGTDPAVLEPFSSAGGTPIIFGTDGLPLPLPEVRMRPQIVGPDGTNTTFFGFDIAADADTFPNFFGTSAAAPHAAAVAALMREASPDLTPGGIEDVLTSGAHDMFDPGFDFDTGFGFIDGDTAVGSVHDSGSCDGVDDLLLSGTPNSGPGTFSATDTITWGDGTFDGVDGFAPEHIFADGFESGDTSSWSTDCPP